MKITKLSQIESLATKWGFDSHSDFAHHERRENRVLTMTCTKGEFSGEVIDIEYSDKTGDVVSVEYSTQFKNQSPKFYVIGDFKQVRPS